MKRICLIQLDGKMPNLALMKLSAWHRARGDDITLIDMSGLKFDRVYASKVFAGGTGIDLKSELPDEIEAVAPDYDRFKTDFSIGFSSRGCIRDCGFCIVREKEGYIREAGMNWIKHSKIILLDNNFLASPEWREKLQYFIDNKIKTNFNQGLDLRLIDKEKAKMLSKVLYYDRKFKSRYIYFAWDNIEDELVIREKLKLLLKYIPNRHVMVYILCGYNTNEEEDLHRYHVLWGEFGVLPYVQIYNNVPNPRLHLFAKWINKRVHKKYSWESWLTRTQPHPKECD